MLSTIWQGAKPDKKEKDATLANFLPLPLPNCLGHVFCVFSEKGLGRQNQEGEDQMGSLGFSPSLSPRLTALTGSRT